MTLAEPISRVRVALEKAGALVLGLVALGLVALIAIAVGAAALSMDAVVLVAVAAWGLERRDVGV